MNKSFIKLVIVLVAIAGIASSIFYFSKSVNKSRKDKPDNLNVIIPDSNDKEIFSFAVLGDTKDFSMRDDDGDFQKAVALIKKENVDLVFSVGDLISSREDPEKCERGFRDWKEIMGDLMKKTYVTVGNHDAEGGEKARQIWREYFSLPINGPPGYEETVYSVDYENTHFVVLNTQFPEPHKVSREQMQWLEYDLAQNIKENIFVFMHEPPFPVAQRIGESMDMFPEERDLLWDIFLANKVDAVFVGHEHIYSRKKIDGIYQFMIANTDANVYDAPEKEVVEKYCQCRHYAIVQVFKNSVLLNVYDIKGNPVDSFSF